MGLVEVAQIVYADLDQERLWGRSIDVPTPGAVIEGRILTIAGWALGRETPVVAVEVVHAGAVIRRVPLTLPRPDVAADYPDVPGAAGSGFQVTVGLLPAEERALTVQAVLPHQQRLPLAAIHLRWVWRETERPPRALILLYHRVAELQQDPWGLSVSPALFAEQLAMLNRHFRPLALEDVNKALVCGDVPHRGVAITFDDGYADNLQNAYPVLERFGIPATFFLTADYIGGEREFWWDELERLLLQPGALPEALHLTIHGEEYAWRLGDLATYHESVSRSHHSWRAWEDPPTTRHALYRSLWKILRILAEEERRRVLDELRLWAGAEALVRPTHRPLSTSDVRTLANGDLVDIGAHTLTHPTLARLSEASQWNEIHVSKTRLEAILGRSVTSFAYPYGGRSDYTAQSVQIVKRADFAYACSAIPGPIERSADRFQLMRIDIGDIDADGFLMHLSRWYND